MLHSRLLQYVDEVARHGSIRAAGARLHVAPSAINRQILMLEDELGEPLFERLPRGMRPTPAGLVLIAHIRRTMQEYRETVAEMRALQALPQGEVVIATMTGLASSVVTAAVVSFHARYPQVRISVRAMSTHDILQAVADSEADLGLGFNIPPSAQLEACWRLDTRLGAVVASAHPLARLASIPLAQCAGYPLIFADRSMLIHGIIADAFATAGLEVEPAFRTNSIEAMKRIAAKGEAVAFLSRFDVAEEIQGGVLAFRPVTDRAIDANVLSLVRRDTHGHGLAGLLFAEEVVATLEDVVGSSDRQFDNGSH